MAYDFIIVGTGAAGSVLAERLSEDGKYSILVLEAGGSDRNPMHLVPKGWVFTMKNAKYTRTYTPEPFGDDSVEVWPRGLIDGGSTTLNGLGWNTGEAPAYDAWEEAGNKGWNWNAFRSALDKIENHKKGLAAYNPRNGRMNVQRVSTRDVLGDTIIETVAKGGARVVDDANMAQGERVAYATTNTRRGMRRSAAAAFLRPARRRENVTVINHAEVIRVIFSEKKAIGVEAEVGGALKEFIAAREVVISAGALESPLLLERSGIGNPDVLRSAGVESLVDSPKVGENLSEHRGMYILYHLDEGIGFNHEIDSPLKQFIAGVKYLITGKGVISSGSFDTVAMLRLNEKSRPGVDAQLFSTAISYGADMQPEKRAGGLLSAYPLYPTSRGSIHITGPRTTDKPTIITNYYETEYDREMIVKVMHKLREIIGSPELKSLGANETFPGAAVTTDADIVRFSLNKGPYGYHTLGTCALGPDDDDVVDDRLRVRGVEGLRVVDASIFPGQPSGNNGGPTSAAAWIAADLILEDARSR